jgi:hypothetical protein
VHYENDFGLNLAALATIHSRVSLAFDICLFLLLVARNTVGFRCVGPPKNSTNKDCRQAAGLPEYVAQAPLKNLIFPSGSFVMVDMRSLSAKSSRIGTPGLLRQKGFESRCRWR